jgi:probable addiction module antidote protein
MPKRPPFRDHDEAVAEMFQRDPQLAVDVLNEALADNEPGRLLIVLKQLAMAFGGIPKVAAAAGLNANSLYRALSRTGNPELNTLLAIVRTMGLQLSVKPVPKPRARRIRKAKAA